MKWGVQLVLCALLWNATALSENAADTARGKRLFLQCQACHVLAGDAEGTVGPSLGAVVGRKAAALGDYDYSAALLASGLVWNEATLDRWLEHPNALVPGTKMIFAGVASAADRAALIAYLKQAGS